MNSISEVIERNFDFESTRQISQDFENLAVVPSDGFPVATKRRPTDWASRLSTKKHESISTKGLNENRINTVPRVEPVGCVDESCFNENIEGYGNWIGGSVNETPSKSPLTSMEDIASSDYSGAYNNIADTPNTRGKLNSNSQAQQLSGWKDLECMDEWYPTSSESTSEKQKLQTTLHIPKPSIYTEEDAYVELDINDPEFNDKLHQKYFPDFPAHPEQLAWMKPVTNETEESDDIMYNDVKDIRFDFRGEMIPTNKVLTISTAKGLHHHSRDAEMAGYTLHELTNYARSTFPSQKCIAIQTFGRILYKLGKHRYPLSVDGVEFDDNGQHLLSSFETTLWKLIEDFQIIEILVKSADERETSSLSIRSYAVDALWLWRAGGGASHLGDIEE